MGKYITELQVSLDEAEEACLSSQGFSKIDVDLNKGAEGKYIYLWYKKRQQLTNHQDSAYIQWWHEQGSDHCRLPED